MDWNFSMKSSYSLSLLLQNQSSRSLTTWDIVLSTTTSNLQIMKVIRHMISKVEASRCWKSNRCTRDYTRGRVSEQKKGCWDCHSTWLSLTTFLTTSRWEMDRRRALWLKSSFWKGNKVAEREALKFKKSLSLSSKGMRASINSHQRNVTKSNWKESWMTFLNMTVTATSQLRATPFTKTTSSANTRSMEQQVVCLEGDLAMWIPTNLEWSLSPSRRTTQLSWWRPSYSRWMTSERRTASYKNSIRKELTMLWGVMRRIFSLPWKILQEEVPN